MIPTALLTIPLQGAFTAPPPGGDPMVAQAWLQQLEAGRCTTLELTGPGSGLLGRLISGKITETLTTENAGFKRTAESLKS